MKKDNPHVSMPLCKIMNWVESYVENYPQEEWLEDWSLSASQEKEELIYILIANFCNSQILEIGR